MEPGSQKEWSNQGQNSNVQIRILVFFASTLYLRYTSTNVLIMPLFLLETFNGSLGQFVTSTLLSLLHRAFYSVAHTTLTIIFPRLFLAEKSRPVLGMPFLWPCLPSFLFPSSLLSSTHASHVLKQKPHYSGGFLGILQAGLFSHSPESLLN